MDIYRKTIKNGDWMGFYGIYHLVMSNIAMDNGPFTVGFPMKNGDFP